MGVDWQDLQEAWQELQEARGRGQTPTLQRLTEMQMAISEALDSQVEECVNRDRWSWQAIGDAIGITRQAASKRWGRKVSSYYRSRQLATSTQTETTGVVQ